MLKKIDFKLCWIAMAGALAVLGGCYNFYKAKRGVNATTLQRQATLDSMKRQNRYFILRSGHDAWHMKFMSLSNDQKSISCTLDSVSYLHQLHFGNGFKGKLRYKKSKPEHNQVLNEVHLFIPEESGITSGAYTLALDKVYRVEVLEKDRKRTTNSYVLGAVGYTLGTMALITVVVAATKSSCPFVSAYDGKSFSLQGEIYGGSIYPQLARHDYMPLKMAPMRDGSLQVKISNELQERQFTDMADLWVVTHPKNVKILADQHGSIYSVSDPRSPVSATLNDNKDVLSALRNNNDHEIAHLDDSSRENAGNEIVLKFKKSDTATRGKLLLTLKNSYWLDLLYGELAKGFGSYYMTYIKDQQSKPAAELLKWVKQQQIPLTVMIRNKSGWKEIENITTIGPLATREMVVPIDISEANDGLVEIKLSSGFMFWEIDYAAIDFTTNNNFELQKLSPRKATDEKGKNVLPQLLKEDGEYLGQPDIGNVATISYRPKLHRSIGFTHSYILHSKGYYEHIRNFKNKPDLTFLSQFRKPDAFPVFGMHLYQQVRHNSLQAFQKN